MFIALVLLYLLIILFAISLCKAASVADVNSERNFQDARDKQRDQPWSD
jgi:Skp family chaperone for outer membrane proteins